MNVSLAAFLGWVFADRERAEASELQAIQAAQSAQAHALQSQLHPHALFNILNDLSELVHEDPVRGEEALVSLAGYMRGLLNHVRKPLAALSEERVLLEQYLAIEQIRFGPRLKLQWEWDSTLEDLVAPPLLLQPLVENALKHGLAPHRQGGCLKIVLKASPQNLILQVFNTGMPPKTAEAPGFGLLNLQDRLRLMPKAGRFELRREEAWTVAEIRLPMKREDEDGA